ncbi:MAG: SDR family oxidoreductase [Planctomycetota bacterium]
MAKTAALAKTALVTGAGSGIGRGVVIALAKAGFNVVLAGRREAKLRETVEIAEQTLEPAQVQNVKLIAQPTDVSREDQVTQLFAVATRELGRLDLLFNNAGINIPASPIEDLQLADWQSVVDVNLTGMFLCLREAVRTMKTQDPQGGRIINNGSIAAYVPRPGSLAYTATKHAVTGLTKQTNLDCREYSICCGQIDIGNADTPLVAKIKEGVVQADGTTIVEPTIDVADVADAVAYMARLPLSTNVPFVTVMSNQMRYFGRG